jgi:hypothetical protein
MLIAEYYATTIQGAELRFELTDTSLSVKDLNTGSRTSLELARVSSVRLVCWKRRGECLVKDRDGQRIVIPSYGFDEKARAEWQTAEYVDFLDGLHILLQSRAGRVRYTGSNFGTVLGGMIITGLSALAILVFALGAEYQVGLFTLCVLGACGLVVGIPTLFMGMPKRYRRGLPPVQYLPKEKSEALVVSHSLGRPETLKAFYRHHLPPPTEETADMRGRLRAGLKYLP